MMEDPQRDPVLDWQLNPDLHFAIYSTAKKWNFCLEQLVNGELRTTDTKLLDYSIKSIGGPAIIHTTQEMVDNVIYMAKALTEIATRIKMCRDLISDQNTESNFYKLFVNGAPDSSEPDYMTLDLRSAIETYASPEAFKINWLEIEFFESRLGLSSDVFDNKPNPVTGKGVERIKTEPPLKPLGRKLTGPN